MEWRDVPGFPGYQVSEKGKLRKDSGYELAMCGRKYVMRWWGGVKRLTKEELLALAWPADNAQPVNILPEKPKAEKAEPFPPDGFEPIADYPGYYLNRQGALLRPNGRICQPRPKGRGAPYHFLSNTSRSAAILLHLTFGPGAASAQGWPEPDMVKSVAAFKAVRRQGNSSQRRCHDCGKPTDNYRCSACWTKLRGFASADVWDLDDL